MSNTVQLPAIGNAARQPSDSARGSIVAGLLILALFFGGLGFWSSVAPLNAAVVGEAVVKVEGNRKSVQHPEGGVVSELRVHEGDKVAAGDVLLVLDDTEARAQVAILSQQYDSLQAAEARLTAERDGLAAIDFPSELEVRRNDASVRAALENQESEFAIRRTALAGQQAILNQRLSQLTGQIAANEALLQTQKDQLQSVVDERASLEGLYKNGLVTKPRMLQMERTAKGIEGQMATTQGQIATGRDTIGEVTRQIAQLQNDRMAEVARDLSDIQSKLQDVTPRLVNARAGFSRMEVRAPYAGEVVDLAVFAVGAVIGRGERLLDIVPSGTDLVIEAKIRVEDIADIAPGMTAEVHFTSYKQRITPLIHGRVSSISADRLTDPRTQVPYYIAEVAVLPAELAASPEIQLYPGMPATVMIMTKERSALDYLVGPLLATLDRSFRER